MCELFDEIDSYILCLVNIFIEFEGCDQIVENIRVIFLYFVDCKVNIRIYGFCVFLILGDIFVERFVEFLELFQILGVFYIIFYVFKVIGNILVIFCYFVEKGLVIVLFWELLQIIVFNV